MASSIAPQRPVEMLEFLVTYGKVGADKKWRGFYRSFDNLADATTCSQQAFAGGNDATVFDVYTGTVINRLRS